jgi:hypothetical protein
MQFGRVQLTPNLQGIESAFVTETAGLEGISFAQPERMRGTYCLYGQSGFAQLGKNLQFSVSLRFTPSTAGLG